MIWFCQWAYFLLRRKIYSYWPKTSPLWSNHSISLMSHSPSMSCLSLGRAQVWGTHWCWGETGVQVHEGHPNSIFSPQEWPKLPHFHASLDPAGLGDGFLPLVHVQSTCAAPSPTQTHSLQGAIWLQGCFQKLITSQGRSLKAWKRSHLCWDSPNFIWVVYKKTLSFWQVFPRSNQWGTALGTSGPYQNRNLWARHWDPVFLGHW